MTSVEGDDSIPLVPDAGDDSAAARRFAVRLVQQLALGQPLDSSSIQAFAEEATASSGSVGRILARSAERDAQGRVAGFGGLSLLEHPHEFRVDGVRLSTWCAWDTLFLPSILGGNAEMTTRDPVSAGVIQVRLSPEGLASVQPAEAAISFVDCDRSQCEDAGAMQEAFCDFVHFFECAANARTYLTERKLTGRVLTMEEGFELGQAQQKELIEAARVDRP